MPITRHETGREDRRRGPSRPTRPGACARSRACLIVSALTLACLVSAAPAAPATQPAFAPLLRAGHRAPEAGEHPRLIVRLGDLAALRRTAQSEAGKLIVERMKQALRLMDKAVIVGRNREVIKEAGFKVAGHGAIYALEGDAASAAAAREVASAEILGFPLKSSLDTRDRLARLHGLVLGYDLCYDAWEDAFRAKVRAFMLAESRVLLAATGGVSADHFESEEHMMACGVAGLVELALLGDSPDAEADGRIAALEKAVLRYLDGAIDERGFGVPGEAVRQAALASGVLPFVHAQRLVLGRDLLGHPAIVQALTPLIYQVVPGVGMPVFGGSSAATDRSGLFALAGRALAEDVRPAAAWLLAQIGGDKDQGVVRPHQGLYMLQAGFAGVRPETPSGQAWPLALAGRKSQVALVRSGWKDSDDLLVLLYRGSLHVSGLGERWISAPGPHAAMWSDSPGAGEVENLFHFNTRARERRTHRATLESRLLGYDADADGKRMGVAFASSGRVTRLIETLTRKPKGDPADEDGTETVPEGGPFEGQRVAGIDLTGRSGAEAVIVLSDTLTGGGQTPRTWVLHFGAPAKFDAEGNTFTLAHNGVTLKGTVLTPRDAAFLGTAHPRVANFVHVDTTADRVEVVLTLSRGAPPAISAGDKGLAGKVTIGKCTARRVGDRIIFEP